MSRRSAMNSMSILLLLLLLLCTKQMPFSLNFNFYEKRVTFDRSPLIHMEKNPLLLKSIQYNTYSSDLVAKLHLFLHQ